MPIQKETKEQLKKRLLRKVNMNGPDHPYSPELGKCWLWMGFSEHGYGTMSVNNKQRQVHRVSFEVFNGEIPDNHRLVRHTCGNKLCVNPIHLLSGTDKDNAQDQKNNNLTAIGEKNPMAKINEQQAIEIINFLGTMSQKDIANKFGITQAAVSKIARGLSWTHIERPSEYKTNFSPPYRKKSNTSHEGVKGSSHPKSKLTEDNVREILILLEKNVPQRKIGKQFGVSYTVINNISNGKTWSHVTLD